MFIKYLRLKETQPNAMCEQVSVRGGKGQGGRAQGRDGVCI